MARFRYVGDEPREVTLHPTGITRRVEHGDLFDVGDSYVSPFESEPDLYVRDEPPAGTVEDAFGQG